MHPSPRLRHRIAARALPLAALATLAVACRTATPLLPSGEPRPMCPGPPAPSATFDGRDYLLPAGADPRWLLGGEFAVEWVFTHGPQRGRRLHDRARFAVADDSLRAGDGGSTSVPLRLRLEPQESEGGRTRPARSWLVLQYTPGARTDRARRIGLVIVDEVPRILDGHGMHLVVTQLDADRFAAAWRSYHGFPRRSWYGRRIIEPDAGYVCAVRAAREREAP